MEKPKRARRRKLDTAKVDLKPPIGSNRSGGQGAHREVGSEGLEEKCRVVIDGSNPDDEPVGQRWGMVEPALWRRRQLGSTPSHQGVCGRHGTEETRVTQGGLVSSKRQVWSRYCDTRGRKGGKTGNTNIDLEPPGGRYGYKRERSSGRCGARSRIGARYSGTRSEQKASDRCLGAAAPTCPKGPSEGEGPVLCWMEESSWNGE
jgi:hypothetical protein